MIWHGPCGKTVQGHVLDVSLKPFRRALRDLDPQLYVKWNPKKLKGWGCWEIRRRPTHKTAVHQGTHRGADIYQLQYVEFNDVHHVLDAAFLNYDAIRRLKEMDTFGQGDWITAMEDRAEELRREREAKAEAELRYSIRHHSGAMNDLYEQVRSGTSLGQILLQTDWSS